MTPATTSLLTFSPTGTTRQIAEKVAQGLGLARTLSLDLTLPQSAFTVSKEPDCDVAVIGSPVYAGRLPPVMVERLQQIQGGGRPAVLLVVYGNRAFEDALLELEDVARAAGFRPLAAAAFIGEHSYSTPEAPIAPGRPDTADLAKAFAFGQHVAEQIRTSEGEALNAPLPLPGNRPGKALRAPLEMAPAVDAHLCSTCGLCGAVCPTGAIRTDTPVADGKRCIQCCACIRACPTGARRTVDPRVLEIAQRLHQTCGHRREPEMYFGTERSLAAHPAPTAQPGR